MITLIFSILGTTIIIVLVIIFLKKPISDYLKTISQRTIEEGVKLIEQKSKELFKEERERIDEKLTSKLEMSEKSLNEKKDFITEVVKNLRNEVNQSQERLIESDKNRIAEFQNLRTIIDQHKNVTQALQITTENLKKVLSNNQLRGSFGQEVAEDLLKMAGFVKGQNYSVQEQQENGKKPDFTVFLPDSTKINIDVKFPFQALQRFQETDNKEQQKKFLAEFKTDIKNKVKEITSREYINPEENTVDFAVMFIPNEMIFSFVYEQYPDVWQDAIKNKVIMCGPFSFTAVLRMVKQSYDNFKYQKDLHKIIGLIKTFEIQYNKFSEELDTLGTRISSVSKQYDTVSGVRDRELLKVIDKIKSGETEIENNNISLKKIDR